MIAAGTVGTVIEQESRSGRDTIETDLINQYDCDVGRVSRDRIPSDGLAPRASIP